MSTLGDIMGSKGLVIIDSIGSFHKVSFKKQKGTKLVKLTTELIKGPPWKENPKECGPQYSCQAIFPVSWDHFRAFEVEQRDLLMRAAGIAKRSRIKDSLMQKARHLNDYFEQLRNRMSIVMGGDHSGSKTSEHHITRWSVLVYFHLLRWQSAMLSDNFELLHRNLQSDFTSLCQDKIDITSGVTQQRIEYSMKFLGYCCPKSGCGAHGFCDSCCPHCGRGEICKKKQSNNSNKKAFDIAWKKWQQTTSASDKSREAFRKTNPTLPSTVATVPADEIVSEAQAWDWLQRHQTLILPPRAPSKFD